MRESLDYTAVAGEKAGHDIILFTLSTCGFCKRAMAFLEREGFAYRYIHMDHIPLETKSTVKKELKEAFGKDVAFPFAVVDDKESLIGFIEPDWRLTLGMEDA